MWAECRAAHRIEEVPFPQQVAPLLLILSSYLILHSTYAVWTITQLPLSMFKQGQKYTSHDKQFFKSLY